jgi:energy-coupling factor transporter ATP-binding protein EcfA2
MIIFDSFSYTYPGSLSPALRKIDLSLDKADFAVITGPSGCGKSTLAHCLCGFLKDGKYSGKIVLDKKDVMNQQPYKLAEKIGLVQQDPDAQLCTLTVEDELAFGLENLCYPVEEIEKRQRWALGVVRGQYLRYRDTLTLSGGEKQKVAIASILALRPDVIILDEPTASLDPKSTAQVREALEGLREKTETTVLILEHRIGDFLDMANKLVIMQEGEIVLKDEIQKVLEKREVLEKIGVLLPKREDKNQREEKKTEKELLAVKDLRCRAGGSEVIKGISFTIKKGEITALMGDNGSGKTTLALHILNLLKPSHGRIFLLGRDIRGNKTSELARDIGLVFQNPNHQLFEETVKDEILFAPRNFNMENAKERAERWARHFKLDAMLKRSPHSLSHGQKRRLNLASILVYRPKLAILDEVFIGQDMGNMMHIMEILKRETKKGMAVFLIAHDPNLVSRFCERVLFLKDGRLAVDAPTEEAFKELARMGEHTYLPKRWENTGVGC